ncbi:MAG TPA: A/G-specific adenine glycosylase [Hyphomicrobiaceae bacterium]|nr:A/G-specific adenine glycosylase [Hyphomicrobiaceae bacterium]
MSSVAKKQLRFRLPGPESMAGLLDWYDQERRDLPWRAKPGRKADPYRVWLSEIMLQQTTVPAVIPYYQRFLERWPSIDALAAAPLDDVLAAWAGLGYYSRARNLHKCAGVIVAEHNGRFPDTEEELGRLPGIGPYTAAAIAAIAFAAPTMPVDGNIERVTARLFAVRDPLPGAKPQIRRLAQTLTPPRRAGDAAQALMDLGASLCSVKRPSCLMCPLERECGARALGLEAALPIKAAKPERPLRLGFAFLALREDGCILLRKRAPAGLLGGMLEVPSTDWAETLPEARQALRAAPVRGDWWAVPGTVTHTFTHFRLETMVYRALVASEAALTFWADPSRCSWIPRRDLNAQALPTVMRKIIAHGLRDN